MQPLNIEFNEQHKAKYLQLAQALRSAIIKGDIAVGTKLSSAREMAKIYQLNRHTIMNALQLLVAEGWIESHERSGYKVIQTLPIQSSADIKQVPTVTPKPYKFAKELAVPTPAMNLNNFKYNFAGGLPDLNCFPYREFKRSVSYVFNHLDTSQFHYGNVAGELNLKSQIGSYLHKARNLKTTDLLICNGSQEALFLISKVFINNGDYVATETLGYPPARKAFSACGAQLIDIKQDEYGLCVEDLKAQLMSNKIKLLYLTPLHQYPTTVTLSPTRRMQIYQLCYQYDVLIIEDDYDHEFHYRCQPLQPMAADDPAGIVIYLSTFSKIMFSAARIGYICASAQVIEQLSAWKQLMNHKNDVVMQLAVANFMQEGAFERHLKRMTKLYKERYEQMSASLIKLQSNGLPIEFKKPDGGMAMWVNLNKPVHGLKNALQKKGVYIQAEPEFYYKEAARSLIPKQQSYIRLGFAGQSTQSIQAGLELIAKHVY
ncbi:MocR-like pyridoxine biosynthesis transcription factor PdxR [Pseudoalteromonas sp. 10-33]|jgi:GntR family transcriptional regulator/MocR family aminotransferase|uniref:MocR-like pyridoxine biosynthesis transcription factor PdxR n=1 Tax=Pseudoalteromonas sp. 10-33 TaxID=1761890 RepID=UPI000732307A|nr:PLP-dependent aminotransferase family protein [Pseudoalteromonas sp. 10-33]KTF11394.1 GntR family transcriptional regulator [Pseudoalteromonas sp. 10-33]